MPILKLSQIAGAAGAPAPTDTVVGVTSGVTDNQFTLAQIAASVLKVGNPISGGGAGYVLFDSAAGNLGASSAFTWDASANILKTIGGSNYVQIVPHTAAGTVPANLPAINLFDSGVVDAWLTASDFSVNGFATGFVMNCPLLVQGAIGTTSGFTAPSLTAKDATAPSLSILKTGDSVLDFSISTSHSLTVVDGNSATVLKLNDSLHASPGLYTGFAGFFLRSFVAITGGGTANVPTLTAGPVSGNPTKWLPYDDNGTTRYVPSW